MGDHRQRRQRRKLRLMHSSKSPNYGTPLGFYDWIDRAFGFTIDVCASPWNAKCARYYSEKENGLAQSWSRETFFMNPPYGEAVGGWTFKARYSACFTRTAGVCLLPSRVDAHWWRELTEPGFWKQDGRLLSSYWVPESRVWWLRYQSLRVGIYHHDQRLEFDLPPGSKKKTESAPFPTSLVLLAHPTWRAPQFTTLGGRPPLTLGMPP